MKTLVILCLTFVLSFLNCATDSTPTYSTAIFKIHAHGYWEAVSGDISVNNVDAIIHYNWYALNTANDGNSVSVTWDDGRACTRSPAQIEGNIVQFSAQGFDVKIEIDSNNEAVVNFKSASKSYQKKLNRTRNDPTVLCY